MLLYQQTKQINIKEIKLLLKQFLAEDIPAQDQTTAHFVSRSHKGKFILRAREGMVFCGAQIIKNIFSPSIKVKIHTKDGINIKSNQAIATIYGQSQEILMKERVLLNLIQRLSGISSSTHQHVQQLNNKDIKILDTRKTTPGLRKLEKYAVIVGGGCNHRMDLSSGIMIKDNHITTSTLDQIIQSIKKNKPKIPVQIEIDHINQITEPSISVSNGFLLDNMSPTKIKKCIEKINTLNTKSRKIFIEVSGSITLKNINRYNIKGVHGISIGALTHQIQSKDIGLDFHN